MMKGKSKLILLHFSELMRDSVGFRSVPSLKDLGFRLRFSFWDGGDMLTFRFRKLDVFLEHEGMFPENSPVCSVFVKTPFDPDGMFTKEFLEDLLEWGWILWQVFGSTLKRISKYFFYTENL